MANRNPTDCPQDSRSSAEEDREIEHGVLTFLLGEHPTHLTVAEVDRALNAGRQSYPEDAVERAARELIGAGLLHRHGDFVMPTRAALYFEWLWEL